MKKALVSLALMLGMILSSDAQTWLPLANGIQSQGRNNWNGPFLSCHYNGKLYVVSKEKNVNNGYDLEVSVWDGNSWSQLPVPGIANYGSPRDIIGFEGSIYISGSSQMLLRYNGSNWSEPLNGSNFIGTIRDLEIHNNKLIAVGRLTNNGNGVTALEYNGVIWSSLPTLGATNFAWSAINAESFGGKLQVVFSPDTSNPRPLNVMEWNGSNWTPSASNFYSSSVQEIEVYRIMNLKGRLYGWGLDGFSLYEFRNDSVLLINTKGGIGFYPWEHVEFDGALYMVGYTNSTERFLKTDGQRITVLNNLPATLTGVLGDISTDGNLLYLTGRFEVSNGSGHNRAMATLGDFAILQGSVFVDDNNDCTLNGSETSFSEALMNINPGNITVSTNLLGRYSVALPPGSYNLDQVQFSNSLYSNVNVSTCNSLPQSLTLSTNSVAQQDLATQLSNGLDGAITLTGFAGMRARQGFKERYYLKVENRGSTTLSNITATVQLPPGLTISSASPNYTSSLANLYTWNLSSLASLTDFTSVLAIELDTAVVNIGDTIIYTASINTIAGDINSTNNTQLLKQEVVAAIDPNDKHVSRPKVRPGASRLEYVINFQNTGTDTAYTVVLEDELENSLILSELEVIAASHDYELRINGRKLIWTFNNILLPDSGADYSGSQGFIRFALGLDPNLQVGDYVLNDADIFFDFQKAIHTNEAKTAVVFWLDLPKENIANTSVDVFPNPAQEELYVKNRESITLEFQLLDINGKVIDEFELKPEEQKAILIQQLEAGMYFLKFETGTFKVIVTP